MGFFDKVKQFLGIGTVKVKIEVPATCDVKGAAFDPNNSEELKLVD